MKSNKKILLVEDDPNFGRILKDYLTINNYEVSLAVNGIEGFEKFNRSEFDLCILDIMMPFKDGLTLAREIREKNKEIPIIFLTAKALKEDVLKGYKVGADDYLNKPFDSEVLLMKIKAIIQRKATDTVRLHQLLFHPRFCHEIQIQLLRHLLSFHQPSFCQLHDKNDLMPRELALTKIWRDDNYFTSRSMDVYIAKIQKVFKK